MIDLHTHLLPGVDDGSRTMEQSVRVLAAFAAAGVTKVVCTPHLDASAITRAPHDAHESLLRELRAAAPAGIEVERGYEVMLDMPGADFGDVRLHLGGSNAVLVELPRVAVPPNTTAELYRIRKGGVVPVLAHPERYRGVDTATVEEWRRAGAVMQVEAASLVSGSRYAERGRAILAAGFADVMGSDCHGDERSLAPALAWFDEVGAREQGDLLLGENPRRLLAGEPLERVAPVALPEGAFARLKSLLLGRPAPR